MIENIWLIFKFCELIASICGAYFHIVGSLNQMEPLPHNSLYCITYIGFSIYSLYAIVSTYFGETISALGEGIIASIGVVLFFITAICSLSHMESDLHLLHLTQLEEVKHPYFQTTLSQSYCSLVAGAIFLLHAQLAFDYMVTRKSGYIETEEATWEPPLEIVFFSENFQEKLMNTAVYRKFITILNAHQTPSAV
ncbi:uncharacterized protein LOC119683934 [Teleopsis dalmanni]|uniref:uncharacterized protein LOC119683934 n=1 Tax=Teleopsis dalmanni TaxID=139649 RepID=UPI0018CEEF0D|nr:uncharacterized protein LOC119683934 [Teleopsis dalmanni]